MKTANDMLERMEAVVRKLAQERRDIERQQGCHPGEWFGVTTKLGDDARAIVAELPNREDERAARELLADWYNPKWLECDWPTPANEYLRGITEAIRKGRQLEREGK